MTHVLIGAVVNVRDGAKPVGWGDDPFDERLPNYRQVEHVSGEDGTILVAGWYWSPEDLELA